MDNTGCSSLRADVVGYGMFSSSIATEQPVFSASHTDAKFEVYYVCSVERKEYFTTPDGIFYDNEGQPIIV